MDFQRIVISMALGLTLVMLWQAWQKDYGPHPQPPVAVANGSAAMTPATPTPADGAIPAAPNAPVAPTAAPKQAGPAAMKSTQRVDVKTDLFDAVIDTYGGDLRSVKLVKYPLHADKPDIPIELLSDKPGHEYVLQSGLLPEKAGEQAPNHNTVFTPTKTSYVMGADQKALEVVLSWTNDHGVTVQKVYTFHRGSYVIDLDFRIANHGSSPWGAYMYRQIRHLKPASSGSSLHTIHTYTGGAIYSPEEKYQKVTFEEMDKTRLNRDVKGGWLAMVQQYFMSAWIPDADQENQFYSLKPTDDVYTLGMTRKQPTDVMPGQSADVGSRIFVGPKLQDTLPKIAPGLELTVDFGILTFIAKPLFWLLEHIHAIVGNWGWAIILLTILVKGAFFKLSATSYKSMAHMRQMQPKMAALKEQFGDDKSGYSQAMMELYRKEKINPLGGCLPIVVQIPVFISLYWVLLYSVEMRQAPFILWLTDLSSADPYYVLPVLMGITMFVQQRLNPSPLDPIQARVMMVLPVAFTFFFFFFPAGLVLYWVVNNSLSIAQQWYITRVMLAK